MRSKTIQLFLALGLAATLGACGSEPGTPEGGEADETTAPVQQTTPSPATTEGGEGGEDGNATDAPGRTTEGGEGGEDGAATEGGEGGEDGAATEGSEGGEGGEGN
jgi:hypothetical protein